MRVLTFWTIALTSGTSGMSLLLALRGIVVTARRAQLDVGAARRCSARRRDAWTHGHPGHNRHRPPGHRSQHIVHRAALTTRRSLHRGSRQALQLDQLWVRRPRHAKMGYQAPQKTVG